MLANATRPRRPGRAGRRGRRSRRRLNGGKAHQPARGGQGLMLHGYRVRWGSGRTGARPRYRDDFPRSAEFRVDVHGRAAPPLVRGNLFGCCHDHILGGVQRRKKFFPYRALNTWQYLRYLRLFKAMTACRGMEWFRVHGSGFANDGVKTVKTVKMVKSGVHGKKTGRIWSDWLRPGVVE